MEFLIYCFLICSLWWWFWLNIDKQSSYSGYSCCGPPRSDALLKFIIFVFKLFEIVLDFVKKYRYHKRSFCLQKVGFTIGSLSCVISSAKQCRACLPRTRPGSVLCTVCMCFVLSGVRGVRCQAGCRAHNNTDLLVTTQHTNSILILNWMYQNIYHIRKLPLSSFNECKFIGFHLSLLHCWHFQSW